MRHVYPYLSALVAIVCLVASAAGQHGGISPVILLTQKSVQSELKLTEDQVKKADAALKKNMAARQAVRDSDPEDRFTKIDQLNNESEKEVAAVLTPDQMKRFRQIYLQQLGIQSFSRAEVLKALEITDEQKEKINTIQEDCRKQMKGLRQPGGSREQIHKKIAEFTKVGADRFVKALSDDQKSKWKQLIGEPFTGDVRIGPPDRLKDTKP